MSANGPFGNQPDDGGAFAVPDNLDWENVGFADEDNTRTQATAPTPVQPAAQQPAPAVQPVQPATVNPGMPVGPYMPPAQPPTQPPAQPATPTQPPSLPPTPAPSMPVAPVLPQQAQAPQPYLPPTQPPVAQTVPTPVAQPVPQYVAPQPPAVPQYVAPEPTYAPTPTPATPAYTHAASAELEDLAEPEWARIGPVEVSEADVTFTGDDESAFGDIGMPVQNAPAFDPNAGKRKKGRAPKPAGKERNPAREHKKGQYAGGRWTLVLIRGVVFLVAALLMAGGLKNILTADNTATPEELAATVQTELGYTGFPTEAAEAFAVRFTREYLTYDSNGEGTEARQIRLAAYSPDAANSEWGWDGDGKQDVITGPFVATSTKPKDAHYATVTVTAQVKTSEWIALAVPIYANDAGAMIVVGPPAFVAQPTLSDMPDRETTFDEDSETAALLTEKVFPGFLSAWAASNSTELDRYITPDATVATRTGLLGAVTYASVDEVKIPLGGRTREGTVRVRWATKKSGTFDQTYTVVVVKNADGNWSVQDIHGITLD